MTGFSAPAVLETGDCFRWKLYLPFSFTRSNEQVINVPAGFVTDLASVPRVLWVIYPPDGKYARAAIIHDWLYAVKSLPRKECDGIFLEAMTVLNVPWLTRKIIWLAVRVFGRSAYRSR